MFRLSKISHHQHRVASDNRMPITKPIATRHAVDLRTDVTPDTLAGEDPADTIA